jgi:hypothetical protein
MPTMTAKQPFRDGKIDNKRSVIAGSKSTPRVIQLTRKHSAIPLFNAAAPDGSDPKNMERDEQDDSNLPSFPGESWFGG